MSESGKCYWRGGAEKLSLLLYTSKRLRVFLVFPPPRFGTITGNKTVQECEKGAVQVLETVQDSTCCFSLSLSLSILDWDESFL